MVLKMHVQKSTLYLYFIYKTISRVTKEAIPKLISFNALKGMNTTLSI